MEVHRRRRAALELEGGGGAGAAGAGVAPFLVAVVVIEGEIQNGHGAELLLLVPHRAGRTRRRVAVLYRRRLRLRTRTYGLSSYYRSTCMDRSCCTHAVSTRNVQYKNARLLVAEEGACMIDTVANLLVFFFLQQFNFHSKRKEHIKQKEGTSGEEKTMEASRGGKKNTRFRSG